MDLTICFIILVSSVNIMAFPPEKAKQVNQLIDEIVAILESEVSASEKQLLENGNKGDSTDTILRIKDMGFNVLTKAYGKIRNLWKLGATPEDVEHLIVQGIESSNVLNSAKVPASEISDRSVGPDENADKESTFSKVLKQSAIKLVKFILAYNNHILDSNLINKPTKPKLMFIY
uniref:Uncharacterized protein n=1 Tax=Homalodisca liturata TaxID=320908 RepID=A0A1B6IPT8_9HEMI